MYDIIIVGAGASGLMAAKLLSAKGKKILLLEAKGRLGGRIYRTEDLSFPAEGGAEFIHGKLKTTFGLLKEAGLKREKLKGNFCWVEKGEWTANNNIVPHWDLLIKKLKECDDDMSIDNFLTKYFHAKKYDGLKKLFRRYVQGYDAADPKYTSALSIRKEMEDEDQEQYRPVPNYSAVINFLKESCLKNKGIIKTGEPVKQIVRNKKIEVITTSGKYFCRKLIIAVPLGVLQCNKREKSFINFPTFLKGHLNAAKEIGNGGVIKFLLEFDRAFWLDKNFLKDKNIPAPSYIFADTIIPTWWTQYPSPKPLLTGWIAGPSSHKIKNYSEKKFKGLAMESLSSVFSIPVADFEKRLKSFKLMNWITEPYILGGYSYSTLQTEKSRSVLQQPVENAFYFAGEYVAKNSSSTVDAALQSGRDVAQQILKDK